MSVYLKKHDCLMTGHVTMCKSIAGGMPKEGAIQQGGERAFSLAVKRGLKTLTLKQCLDFMSENVPE